jgi:toxin FitB
VISILELELGTLLIERRDKRQGTMLRSWLDNRVLPNFAGRILIVDQPTVMNCAKLHLRDPMEYRDSLIAATALVHRMTLITRNVSHFERTGVEVLNPWTR